jgi:hypothetical protein
MARRIQAAVQLRRWARAMKLEPKTPERIYARFLSGETPKSLLWAASSDASNNCHSNLACATSHVQSPFFAGLGLPCRWRTRRHHLPERRLDFVDLALVGFHEGPNRLGVQEELAAQCHAGVFRGERFFRLREVTSSRRVRAHRVEARAPLSRYFLTAPVRTYLPSLPTCASNCLTVRRHQHR